MHELFAFDFVAHSYSWRCGTIIIWHGGMPLYVGSVLFIATGIPCSGHGNWTQNPTEISPVFWGTHVSVIQGSWLCVVQLANVVDSCQNLQDQDLKKLVQCFSISFLIFSHQDWPESFFELDIPKSPMLPVPIIHLSLVNLYTQSAKVDTIMTKRKTHWPSSQASD